MGSERLHLLNLIKRIELNVPVHRLFGQDVGEEVGRGWVIKLDTAELKPNLISQIQ